ncbi:MAG: phosphoribosylglycinamide formyltransferase [Bacteroidia bacterium]|nr:phosphoribosylglycinamide formyltransferase [Bacteroidia bacterium]
MTRLAVFASGEGTNAENLIRHFQNHPMARVVMVVSDKAEAPVIEKAKRLHVPVHVLSADEVLSGKKMNDVLKQSDIHLIVLAGYLRKIPGEVIEQYPQKIINLHPALLPFFGGKGMYGKKVHEAVIRSGVKESGITIHFVNEHYDDGEIIFQKSIPVEADETSESLQKKIRELEWKYYPEVIDKLLKGVPES